MITVENLDTKKYCIISTNRHFYLASGDRIEIDADELLAFRVYSRFGALNRIIKAAMFLLCILFVFLDTDYENGEFALVSVRFKCKAKAEELKLTLASSPLINISKSGGLSAEFVIEKSLLIAHIISVFLYSLAIIILFIFLGIFTTGEVLSPLFYVMSGAAAALAVYMIYYTVKRYKKTLIYLNEYFRNYVY